MRAMSPGSVRERADRPGRAAGRLRRPLAPAALIAGLAGLLLAGSTAAQSVQVVIAPLGPSGVSALAVLGPVPEGTAVQLMATEAPTGTVAVVHAGTCDAVDPAAVGLIGDASAGLLQVHVPVPFDGLLGTPHVIALHPGLDMSVVLGCGEIPTGAVPSGGPTPRPTPSTTVPPQPSPSPEPSAAPGLAAMFPAEIGGEALVVRHEAPDDFVGPLASVEGGPALVQALRALLAANGATIDDLQIAHALSSGYEPFFNLFAFRAPGVDGEALADVVKPMFPLMFDEAMEFTEMRIGGKDVVRAGTSNKFVYVTGDTVFVAIAFEPQLTEFFQKLP